MKVKIHPSPPPHGGTAASGGGADIAAVLRLLPAAIVALSAVLGTEDKEVLAYLILRSAAEERPRCRKTAAYGGGGGSGHRAAFDCGCFDCYTGFWYRWDRSPNRELIHQAIEAFEESLTNKERGGARGRRRGRKGKDKDVPAPAAVMPALSLAVPVAVEMESEPAPATECAGDCEKGIDNGEGDNVARGYEMEQEEEVAVERRGRWPDVMGIIQSRLFSFWGPGI